MRRYVYGTRFRILEEVIVIVIFYEVFERFEVSVERRKFKVSEVNFVAKEKSFSVADYFFKDFT